MDNIFIKENAVFEKNVLINENLLVENVISSNSSSVTNDLNTNNLNTFGLVINHGNTVSKGDIFISNNENENDYTYLKNNGTILSKKLLINSDESDSKSNINVKSISLNRVIESLKQYNNSIIYVNDIVNYILGHIDEIKLKGMNEVLKPYVENNYYENFDYYYISTLTSNISLITNNICLSTYNLYNNYIDIKVQNIVDLNKEGKYIYFKDESDIIINYQLVKDFQAYNLFVKEGIQKKNYYTVLKEWDNGIQIDFKCIVNIPNILPNIEGINPDYIVIASGVKLNLIIQDVDNIKNFSPEYISFQQKISENLFILQEIYNNLSKQIFKSSIEYDVWEYNTTTPSLSKCYYSSLYLDWINKYASEVVVLGTDINIAQLLTYIFTFMNKNLFLTLPQQVGVIQFSYNNNDYVFLTKIIELNGIKYVIINSLLINEFFNQAITTNGDLKIEGAVSVNNYDGSNVFNLHTEKKVLEVNGNIGVNIQNPNALLDIQGISVTEIDKIIVAYSKLNGFIFGYYDYFINNFSNTDIRDWTLIYDKYPNKNVISVSTINLPFNFIDTNSSSPLFSEFINNFNNYLYFGYTEEQFKIEYQGKTASEITNPYFTDYFYSVKDYFLIIWNQKDYYLNYKYMTFTNIVNYFGGPVLRMHVIWYDNISNKLQIFASNLKIDNFLLNENLNRILSIFFDSLYSCEQLTNLFTNLLSDPIIQQKQVDNPLFLTEYVNKSYYKDRFGYPQNYVFSSDYLPNNQNLIKFLFHELFPNWASYKSSQLQIPGQDLIVGNATSQIIDYYLKYYNQTFLDRIFMTNYFFQFEYKVAFSRIIEIQGKEYRIGSGINILDYIKKNVLSSGDQQFNGSLRLIEPSSNQTVISMDTTEKQVTIQYPLGLGTENPRSILTIEDVSITNLFDYLDELSKKNRYVSDLSKQLQNVSSNEYSNIINSYINPFTNLPFIQSVDSYFAIVDNDIYNISNTYYNYQWYLKLWENILFSNTLVPTFNTINNKIKPDVVNAINKLTINTLISTLLNNLIIFDLTWGKKIGINKYFTDNNGIIKSINTGINFNEYFTTYNSNKNLQNIIGAIQAIQLYNNLQYLLYNNLKPDNFNQIQNFITQTYKAYKKYTLWVSSYPENYNDTILYLNSNGDLPHDLNNLIPTATIYDMIYNNGFKGNLTEKQVLVFYQKIVNIQQQIQKYNGNTNELNYIESNIVGYRTDDNYWIANWIWQEITSLDKKVTILSIIEFNVDDYLNQSIQMIGDLQMAGNLTLMNPISYFKYVRNEVALSDLKPLISIYPEEEFIGIGSQKIFTQYALNYSTIDKKSNQVFAKNHVIVSNPYYPNLVGERIADPSNQSETDEYLKDNFSSFTVRRTSNKYTIEEMVELGNGKFGFDISYEVQDKYGVTYEMAESGVRIDSLKKFDNGITYPIPKYFWNYIDNASDIDNIITKDIMTLDAESRLKVSKIKLGSYDLTVIKDEITGIETLKWGNIILGKQ